MKVQLTALMKSTAIAAGLLAAGVTAAEGGASIGAATFNPQGELVLPEGFREWVFIGAPLRCCVDRWSTPCGSMLEKRYES